MADCIFKERLQIAMKDAEINGAELAKACGVSRSSICRYLKGERGPKTDLAQRMSEVLNVPISWILGYTDSGYSKAKVVKYNPIDYDKLTRANKLRIQGYYQALLDTQSKIPK